MHLAYFNILLSFNAPGFVLCNETCFKSYFFSHLGEKMKSLREELSTSNYMQTMSVSRQREDTRILIIKTLKNTSRASKNVTKV